jgi:hypothetical protein
MSPNPFQILVNFISSFVPLTQSIYEFVFNRPVNLSFIIYGFDLNSYLTKPPIMATSLFSLLLAAGPVSLIVIWTYRLVKDVIA